MPLSEIKKALYWELQEDIKLEEYYYTYTLEDEKENYNLKVNLIGKALVDLWQQLAKAVSYTHLTLPTNSLV